jgi:HD-like signal output (HDOD) protein
MFDWFSPEKAMSIQAASIFNKFSNKNTTPYIPSIVFEIQKQLEDPNCSLLEVTKSIKKDPVLSLNLMRIANLRNLGKDVITKLDHALSAIGLKRTAEFLLLIALGGFKFHSKIYTKSKFWEESLVAGMIAEKVATDLNLAVSGDLAFISASLCNIGKLAGCIYVPEQIDAIYKETQTMPHLPNWTSAEQSLDAIDHRILGEIAASLWGFPGYILESIQHHHDIPAASRWGKSPATLNDVVIFSNQLSHWIRLDPCRIDKKVLNESSKLLGLNESQLLKFANSCMPFRVLAQEQVREM